VGVFFEHRVHQALHYITLQAIRMFQKQLILNIVVQSSHVKQSFFI